MPRRVERRAERAPSTRHVARRIGRVLAVLLRGAALHLAARAVALTPFGAGRPPPDLPSRLREALEEIGGAAVKLGQMLSTHGDIVPAATCRALSGLIDRIRPVDPRQLEAVFVAELGAPPARLFDRFDADPVATGSIGQVHRAARHGRELAVKVLRPAVPHDFAVDLRLLATAARLIDRLRLRRLSWLVTPIEELVEWTREELDLAAEARRQQAFAAATARDRWRRIPDVVPELSTARILTMEWLSGPTLMELLRAREAGAAPPADLAAFTRRLVRSFFADAFRNGLYHGDLHPANILVLAGGVVGYVDFGITGALDPRSRWHLMAMTAAWAESDLRAIAASFLELAADGGGRSDEALVRGLDGLERHWAEERARGEPPSLTRVMIDLLLRSRASRIWPRRPVLRYIRSVVVLDGLVKSLGTDGQVEGEIGRYAVELLAWRLLGVPGGPSEPATPGGAGRGDGIVDLELAATRRAIRRFGLARPAEDDETAGAGPRAVARHDALWGAEGLGYRRAERGDPAAVLRGIWADLPADPSPARAAATYVGACLSLARRTVGRADLPDRGPLPEALDRFLDDSERACPAALSGLALDALGLVVRTLRPGRLRRLDELLGDDDRLRAHFWHGVGRGLYFVYPRGLFRRRRGWLAHESIAHQAPDPLARRNVLSGLAFPLVLVNLPAPRVLESYLEGHGTELRDEAAFADGVARALLLWLHWAGDDELFAALGGHRPAAASPLARELWPELVVAPCHRALALHRASAGRPPSFGGIFRC